MTREELLTKFLTEEAQAAAQLIMANPATAGRAIWDAALDYADSKVAQQRTRVEAQEAELLDYRRETN